MSETRRRSEFPTRCQKRLVYQADERINRFQISKSFERGEIVSPVGCIASKVRLNLATPDARHRRPLKFLYLLCVKSQIRSVFQIVLRKPGCKVP